MTIAQLTNATISASMRPRTIDALRFTIGQRVTHKAFTDCFKNPHEAITGLTVAEITKIDNPHAPHWRIKATKDTGDTRYVEACQDFFVPEPAVESIPEDSERFDGLS
jgi:hypothetical protein